MYRGYQTERSYHNAKIHALAYLIHKDGADDFLKETVNQIIIKNPATNFFEIDSTLNNHKGVKSLTDLEARGLYKDLLNTYKMIMAITPKEKNSNMMTDEQRKKIIKITRYKFNWAIDVTFSKIIEFCPELIKRLTPWQIKQTKILPLYNLINRKQADQIIKRLEQIEKRNKEQSK